jgi:hypothetical protein
VVALRLFSEILRTDRRPKRYNEPLAPYYDISARPTYAAFREIAERWFQKYPAGGQKDLKARFRSAIDFQHRAAFFELYIHELLLAMGFEVNIHPHMLDTGNHPDFLVSKDGSPLFYLEATSTLSSEEETSTQRMVNELYDLVNRLDSPNFFIDIGISEIGASAPPARSLRTYLERWLGRLDPDDERARLEAGDVDGFPCTEWKQAGWNIYFEAIAKSPTQHRSKPGIRPIAVISPMKVSIGNSHNRIRCGIERKAKKYGQLSLPLVLGISVFDEFHVDMIDMMNALFGEEGTQCTRTVDGTWQDQEIRLPNGAWFGRRGPRNTLVSAALIVVNLMPSTMAQASPLLFHHPWASNPLAPERWPLTQEVFNERSHRMDTRQGQSASDFLGLPSPWPIPEWISE